MQQSLSVNLKTSHVFARRLSQLSAVTVIIIGTILISGCSEDPKNYTSSQKHFAGTSLSLVCQHQAFAEAIAPMVQSWAERSGAKVTLKIGSMLPDDDADIGVIEVQELGKWADLGELQQIPVELRAPDHPFQWTGLLPAYREQLILWGGQARAIPLAGDGYVIVYRTDRLKEPRFMNDFNAQFARNPTAPTTWEEFAAIAGIFSSIDGKPSVPALTNTELASLFFRIAACYDRKLQKESFSSKAIGGLDALSFQFDLNNGKPRLTSPAFVATAEWFANLVAKKCLPPPAAEATSDPAAALAGNQASIAVLSLAQLARFSRENGSIPERFGLAPLPGTRSTFDHEKQRLVQLPQPNYVPYFTGGRLGVVRTRCSNPAAAFDLLADLGGPTRSMEIISSSELGAGPFRISHLAHERLQIWYGYGLDSSRSDLLRNALLQYINLEAKTPISGLRGPDQAELSSTAAKQIGKIASGTPAEAGLKQLLDEWNQIDSKTPENIRIKWLRLAAGLN